MCFETIAQTGSTNADMKARAASGACEGFWLRAENQTGGVGRLGRKWESPKGNLFCSSLVEIRAGDPAPASLSFVASLAVFDTIRHHLPSTEIRLKWPNDVIVSGAKICGILLERAGDKIVVGIGINVAVAPGVGDRAVTSMAAEGAATACDADTVLRLLATKFEARLQDWRLSSVAAILQTWQAHAHPVGSPITTSVADGSKISGRFEGLTDDGALRLRKADGTLIEIRAGDIEVG